MEVRRFNIKKHTESTNSTEVLVPKFELLDLTRYMIEVKLNYVNENTLSYFTKELSYFQKNVGSGSTNLNVDNTYGNGTTGDLDTIAIYSDSYSTFHEIRCSVNITDPLYITGTLVVTKIE